MATQEFLQTTVLLSLILVLCLVTGARSYPIGSGEPIRFAGARFIYPESGVGPAKCRNSVQKERPITTSGTTYSYAYPRSAGEENIRYAGGRYTYPESAVGPAICPKEESSGIAGKEVAADKVNIGPANLLGALETPRYDSSQRAGGSGCAGGGSAGVRNVNIAAGENKKGVQQQGYFGNNSFLAAFYDRYEYMFGHRGAGESEAGIKTYARRRGRVRRG